MSGAVRERCEALVYRPGMFCGGRCSRDALPGQKFCRQHSPEAEAERKRASDERYEAKRRAEDAAAERNAVRLLERLGYTVAPPPGEEREQ